MKPTILIVDDDPALRIVISALLQEEGFNVIAAVDGDECMRVAYERHPDLVLLDIMMPNKDGREVCRQLRQISNVPIIMLTALSTETEKVARLNDGADDYLTKPFYNAELVARIRSILRRARTEFTQTARVYEDDALYVDFGAQRALLHNKELNLSPKEWRILEYLMQHPNRPVPRQALLEYAWGKGYDIQANYNYLKVFISHLRHKLHESIRRPRYIHTERHAGYWFQTYN